MSRWGTNPGAATPEVRHDRWLRSTTVGSPVREPTALDIGASERPCPRDPFGERTSGAKAPDSEASVHHAERPGRVGQRWVRFFRQAMLPARRSRRLLVVEAPTTN